MDEQDEDRAAGLEVPVAPLPGEEHRLDFDREDLEPREFRLPDPRRMMWVVAVLATLVLMAILPPLVNVNRYRRQIQTSISLSLGRPVHMDSVALNLLPMPGFTLQGFVVSEDPDFGAEPVIRANTVRARLRWRSLWRRRVEFSRISLTEPSVNLVRRADGRWNLESILLQASRMPAAPTGQRNAGDAPRFPYIEATGARVNLKMGVEKMPLSLTEADFALWLPQPQQWRVRLEAKPTRTDEAAIDTGVVRLEGALGKAAKLEDVPVDLALQWTAAPMGAVSRVLLGRDIGFRGEMTLRAAATGTVGQNTLTMQLDLNRVRRQEFVPVRTLDVDLQCRAETSGVFRRLSGLQCGWLGAAPGSGLAVTGEVPDLRAPRTAELTGELKGIPAADLLDGMRLVSARISPALTLDGTASGQMKCCGTGWIEEGIFTVDKARLALGAGFPFVDGDVTGMMANGVLTLTPMAMNLGGTAPASVDGHVDAKGYGLRVNGPVTRARMMELGMALPQFGDGLESSLPVEGGPVNLVGSRVWSEGMVWGPGVTAKVGRKGRRRR